MSGPTPLWQPVSKPPYEGDAVMVWAPSEPEPIIAYYSAVLDEPYLWRCGVTRAVLDFQPTCWMPLPAVPETR